jgi:hypothetical protein
MGRECSTHGKKMNAYTVFAGKLQGNRPLGRPRSGRIMLKWILEKWDGVVWTGFIWLRIGTSGGLLSARQ